MRAFFCTQVANVNLPMLYYYRHDNCLWNRRYTPRSSSLIQARARFLVAHNDEFHNVCLLGGGQSR